MPNSIKQIARVFHYRPRVVALAVLALFFGAGAIGFQANHTAQAAAGVNAQFNFQGRLLTNAGATVPDGNYNMRFKIYQDGDGVAGGGDETLKWTETRLNSSSQGVVVRNGYFSVYLGSVNPFGTSVDWNQDTLWLSMEVTTDGTIVNASPTWNGEMSPFKRLGASPYALNTKYLGGLTASQFIQLAQGVQADTTTVSSIFLNKTGASGNILQFQKNGSDVLTLDNSGLLTASGGLTATGAVNLNYLNASSVTNIGHGTSATVSLAGGSGSTVNLGSSDGTFNVSSETIISHNFTVSKGSSTALTVGRNGATNPALQVDTSTISSATGLSIASKAAGAGVTLSAISSGTNEDFSIDAKGSGALNIGNTSTGNVLLAGGSSGTGCTVTNSTGAFACTGGLSASNFSGSSSGTNTGDQTSVTGNAGTATALQTARNINGVSFNGTADITVTAAAGTLSGATLASGVTASSLTSLGTLTGLAVSGTTTLTSTSVSALVVGRNGATNPAFQVDASTASSATGLAVASKAAAAGVTLTAISSGTNEDFSIDAKGSGLLNIGNNSTGNVLLAGGSSGTGCTVTNSTGAFACTGGLSGSNFSGSSSGTNTGDQTSVTGNAGTATALQTARLINGVSFNGTADITITAAADASTLTGTTLAAGVINSSLQTLGTLSGLTVVGTTNINTSGTATTTIGALSGTDLILRDANWNITGAGAATVASLDAGSGAITTSGTIGTAATTAFTGATGVFSTSVTTPSIDRASSGTLSIGTGQATAITLGGASTVSTAAGGLTITTGKNFIVNGDTFTDLTGTGLAVSGSTLAIDQAASLTWTGNTAFTPSGTNDVAITTDADSTFTQTFTSATNSTVSELISITNSATSGSVAVAGQAFSLIGTNNASGANSVYGISFNPVSAATNNTFYALNFSTGLTDILRYNNTQIISGTGILQSAGLSGTYSNALTLNSTSNALTGTIGQSTALAGSFTTLTSTGITTIGNNSATVAVNSSDWDISTTGDLTGIGGLTMDGSFSQTGTGTYSTGTGAVSLNGTTTIADGKALILGTTAGQLATITLPASTTGATGGTGLNIADANGVSLLKIRNLARGTSGNGQQPFNGLVVADAFAATQSYFGEEFDTYRVTDCINNTFTASTNNLSRGTHSTGAVAAAGTASCGTNGGDNLSTEISSSSVSGTSNVANTCSYATSTGASNLNGIERIKIGTTGTPTVSCLEYLGTAADNVANMLFNTANLPQIQMKWKSDAVSSTQRQFMGISNLATAKQPMLTTDKGIYFSNCSAPTTPTCGATWSGIVSDGASTPNGATSTNAVNCPTNDSQGNSAQTTNFMYGRIESRKAPATTSVEIEFFVDYDVSNGINETSCGTVTTIGSSGGLTGTAMTMFAMTSTAAAASTTTLSVDYFRAWQDDAPEVAPETISENITTAPATGSTDMSDDLAGLTTNEPGVTDPPDGVETTDASSPIENTTNESTGLNSDILSLTDRITSLENQVTQLGQGFASGGLVTGDAEFRANVMFAANVTFKKDVAFEGNLVLHDDTRGIDVGVPVATSTKTITFAKAQADAKYAVQCTPGWGTYCYVTNKTKEGFTLNFTVPAGANATLDWLLIK